MGYYTKYTLEAPENNPEVLQAFRDCFCCDDDASPIPPSLRIYDPFEEPLVWYQWKEELEGVSEKFPNVTIILSGIGEDPLDVWRAYARNGKVIVHKPEIVWPEPPDMG